MVSWILSSWLVPTLRQGIICLEVKLRLKGEETSSKLAVDKPVPVMDSWLSKLPFLFNVVPVKPTASRRSRPYGMDVQYYRWSVVKCQPACRRRIVPA